MKRNQSLISSEIGTREVSRSAAALRLRRMRKLCGSIEVTRHKLGLWVIYQMRGNGGLTFAVQTVRS